MLESTVLWLAITIYHESRGEQSKPQIAVAQVVLNRAKAKGVPVSRVIRKKRQFSWKKHKQPWKTDPEGFLKCSLNAVRAIHGPDITKGATHFHSGKKPYWAKKMKQTRRYGGLYFYKARSPGRG